MQAPLTGLALMLELTSGGFGILIPMVAATVTATVTATVVARQVDLQLMSRHLLPGGCTRRAPQKQARAPARA